MNKTATGKLFSVAVFYGLNFKNKRFTLISKLNELLGALIGLLVELYSSQDDNCIFNASMQ
jgi:hypothetical protein